MKFALIQLRSGWRITGQVLAQTAEAIVIAPEWSTHGEDTAQTVKLADVVKIQTLVPQKG